MKKICRTIMAMASLFAINHSLAFANVEGMIFIKGGCFQMGDAFGDGFSEEKPVHEVCVEDFYLGEHEVTQGEWTEVMGSNPSHFKDCGDDCPVENVSWVEVQKYLQKLTQKTAISFRLPTEAEWEYAAREGGKPLKWAGTSSGGDLSGFAWNVSNSAKKTHPVKAKKPNSLGLYDMSGNVREWVEDWYGGDYYKNSSKSNPKGPGSGEYRVLRGGSWKDKPRSLRATGRLADSPNEQGRGKNIGFRLARDK